MIGKVRTALDNDPKMRQTIEHLEALNSKVTELSTKKQDELIIKLESDMVMMLKAKLKVAHDLSNEFTALLAYNENTFTKQMQADMRRIVTKANKDHNLELQKEQQILAYIPISEEWFLATYEKLKKVGGKALHQVDFKDKVQLSSVL